MKTLTALVAWLIATQVHATSCSASSGSQHVPLLELYTSEGCDSCPPADRWISALPARGLDTTHVVTLAYHVDYWNYLGWKDPFARARFTQRQRLVNARIGNRAIYTPQLMLDGKDYRRTSHDAFARQVAAINREKPRADIALTVSRNDTKLHTTARVQLRDHTARASVFVALYENRLTNQVTAGENRGKRLEHDFVVRELAGPFAVKASGSINHAFPLQPGWKARDLGLAAFLQDAASGDVVQALALPYCGT